MAHLDRQRAERLLNQAGLDALILFSPENFTYATGAEPGVATMWRKIGAVAVLVPAAAEVSEMAVVSDLFGANFRKASHITDIRESPVWVETSNLEYADLHRSPEEIIGSAWRDSGRAEGFKRPTTFDPMNCYHHLADTLSERGLMRSRIGIDGSAVAVSEFTDLRSALGNVELVDATDVINRLKMVKSAGEITNLRLAVQISEHGIQAVHKAIALGVSRNELAELWKTAVRSHPLSGELSGAWEYLSVGTNPWGGNAIVRAGDLVKVDVGCLVDGYTSDTGRTFVMGSPNHLQSRLFGALLDGFEAGSKLLRPGVALSDVHRVTQEAIRAAGFARYTRGHFGHGLGAGLGSEEWPFISADANTEFEPGMVMAFECPWYIDGVGGMIIENQFLITESGHETMNALPIGLVEIST